MKKLYKGKIFYGWYIVVAVFIILACSMGIFFNTASLFLKPVSEDLGVTRSAVSATLTIRSVIQMAVSLLASKIFSRYNIRRVMKLSTIVLILSFFSYSLVNSIILYYVLTALASIAFSLMSILPLTLILNNWFNEKLGTVTGIAFMGSGVGGMVFNFLAGKWILAYGWRTTYKLLALIMLIAVVPCIFFVIRIHPRDVGLKPLGEPSIKPSDALERDDGVMLKEAIKTTNFQVLIICSILFSMCINTLVMTTAPHLTDIGYSTTYSANVVAICMGAIALGKIALGYVYDKLGVRLATIIACVSTGLGLFALTNFDGNTMLILLVVGSGIGCAYGTIGPPVITKSLYGKRDYSSIYGIVFAANAIGSGLGPFFNGYIYDISKTYSSAFKVALTLVLINIIAYIFLLPQREKAQVQVDP